LGLSLNLNGFANESAIAVTMPIAIAFKFCNNRHGRTGS
jgi:hypothetical protein